jgi:hypothetical protein
VSLDIVREERAQSAHGMQQRPTYGVKSSCGSPDHPGTPHVSGAGACRGGRSPRRAIMEPGPLDRYGHLFADELDAVSEKPDRARRSDVPQVCPEVEVVQRGSGRAAV